MVDGSFRPIEAFPVRGEGPFAVNAGELGSTPSATRRSWRARHGLWVLAWVLYSALLGLVYVRVPPSPDAAVFDYIGWRATNGARLYVDVAEQNFPGQMWLQTASTALFGNHLWSYRLFDYGLTLLGGGVLLALLSRARLRLAGFVAVPLYQAMIVTSDYWISGQRDVTAALFLLGAGLAYHVRRSGKGLGWLLLFAALASAAVLVRPTYAAFAPFLLVAEFLSVRADRPRRLRVLRDAMVAAGVCLALLTAVGVVLSRDGGGDAWFECVVLFNREIYGQTRSLLETTTDFLGMAPSWRWYLALGVLGAWFWRRDRRDSLVGLVFASLVATSIASGYVQRKGFGYHIGGLLAPMAAFGAFFVARSLERARERATWPRLAVAVLACAVAVVGTGRKLWTQRGLQFEVLAGARSEADLLATFPAGPITFSVADAVEAADYVRATTREDETLLTWSRALHVNFLAARASPLRFPTVGMLELATPSFSRARAWAEETRRAFASRPPALILVPSARLAGEAGLWDPRSPSEAVQVVRRALESDYTRERSFGSMDLYRRRP